MNSSEESSSTSGRSVLTTEFGGAHQMNPTPTYYDEDTEVLAELYLSPEKLKAMTNKEDLDEVATLDLCVDTQHNTLGNFGSYLPNLTQLRMSNSLVFSVRDLGTSLSHLQVLWLVRSCLADLDGIPSLSSLKELYVAYNNISDLSQVSMLECLEVLDLEGNNVDDLVQIQYMGLCSQLRTLTLEGNPVCSCPRPGASQTEEYSYRSVVRTLVPQLRYLDDVPVEEDGEGEEEEEEGVVGGRAQAHEDLTLLKESIKENTSSTNLQFIEERAASSCSLTRPGSGSQRPGTSRCSTSRPGSARPSSGSRPGSGESDPVVPETTASELTHGAGRILLCGNPVQALRARRQKTKPQAAVFPSNTCLLPSHVPEHTYDTHEDSDDRNRSDVFAELRTWRKEHNKRLLAIEKDRQPQVMAILHDEEDYDEGSEDDEDVSGHSLTSDHEEEEEEEEETKESSEKTNWRRWGSIDSPDSSFRSLSSDLSELEAVSPDDCSRQSLPPQLTLTVSPPLPPAGPSAGRKLSDARARRLKPFHQPHPPPPGTARPEPLTVHKDLTAVAGGRRSVGMGRSLAEHCRPASSPVLPGHREPCLGAVGGDPLSTSEHQPVILNSKTLGRSNMGLSPQRPRTARAALQRLSNHYPLLPRRPTTEPH